MMLYCFWLNRREMFATPERKPASITNSRKNAALRKIAIKNVHNSCFSYIKGGKQCWMKDANS
jgi:hypothetical protein